MHVAINTSPLQSGHKHRGSGTYVRLLLEALRTHVPTIRITEFTSETNIPADIDCVHYPFFDPFFLTLPKKTSLPLLVTVHDLIPLAFPEQFPPGIRGKIKWEFQKSRLKKSAAIITDSQHSKKDIQSILPYDTQKIFSIPLAPDPVFKPINDKNLLESLQQKYKLPSEFLLYVGDVNWNKNIPRLLEALKEIHLPLVLVGKAFLNEDIPEVQLINKIISDEQLNGRIIKLGFVVSEDLPSIYSLARATICVSTAEGFGFPVLESMACGTPCVVSDCSSLVEIAGPSILVNPLEVRDITRGIREVLQEKKQIRLEECIQWAGKFSWKKVALETFEVYHKTTHN